jgi:hypothetical protein
MKPRMLVWLAVFVGLVLALNVVALPGWFLGAVVVAALVLAIPLSVKRYRLERNLARTLWRALTTR